MKKIILDYLITILLILLLLANSAYALRFRDDASKFTNNDESIIEISKKQAKTVAYSNNIVLIEMPVTILGKKYIVKQSGWLLNSCTVLTSAHDLSYLFSIANEAYVTNDPKINSDKKRLNKYNIEKIIIHPNYEEKETPFLGAQAGINPSSLYDNSPDLPNSLWSPKHLISSNHFLLGTRQPDMKKAMLYNLPVKEYKGVDLAILHLNKPVPNVKSVDFFDPTKLAADTEAYFYSYGGIALSNGKRFDDDQGYRYKHYGISHISFISELNILYSGRTSLNGIHEEFYYKTTDNKFLTHTLEGDSGCAILVKIPNNEEYKLVAINSGYTNAHINISIVPNYDLFTPIYPYRDWIINNLAEDELEKIYKPYYELVNQQKEFDESYNKIVKS